MASHHDSPVPDGPVRAIVVASGFSCCPRGPAGLQAEIYQYVSPNGTISLTNVPSDARYRKIEVESARFHSVLSERELEPLIKRHSSQQQLHPALIRAVIKAESNFDPRAVSRAGAIGLMQLMPANRRAARCTGYVRSGRECGRRHEVFEAVTRPVPRQPTARAGSL